MLAPQCLGRHSEKSNPLWITHYFLSNGIWFLPEIITLLITLFLNYFSKIANLQNNMHYSLPWISLSLFALHGPLWWFMLVISRDELYVCWFPVAPSIWSQFLTAPALTENRTARGTEVRTREGTGDSGGGGAEVRTREETVDSGGGGACHPALSPADGNHTNHRTRPGRRPSGALALSSN